MTAGVAGDRAIRVALVGDVHGNLPALEAVLAHARGQGVDAIWNTGDFVGYGAFPDQVVRGLREAGAVSVIGNYDLKALRVGRHENRWWAKRRPEKRTAFKFAAANLSLESRWFLESLPERRWLEAGGRRVQIVHGSPAANDEHLWPDTPEERLRELARLAEADVVVCGHSHHPFVRRVDGVWFINTGSIGRPDDGDARACYAVLDVGPGCLSVRHYRLDYDVARAVQAMRACRLPEAFARMLLAGRNVDHVLDEAGGDLGVAGVPRPVDEADERLRPVLELAEHDGYEAGHAHQVTRLALALFDGLQAMHGLGAEDRFRLRAAALLHDIGWAEGQRGHHKTALRRIVDTRILDWDRRERRIIGSVARYHRGAAPRGRHPHFGDLGRADRRVVRVLAGLLRLADGLDDRHRAVIEGVRCSVEPEEIVISCTAREPAGPERRAAEEKGRLLAKLFRRALRVEWTVV